jgi:hypothetical protein
MCNTISWVIRVTRVKSAQDEMRLMCPYEECKKIFKSWQAVRVHLGRIHSSSPNLEIYLKNIGKITRSLGKLKK